MARPETLPGAGRHRLAFRSRWGQSPLRTRGLATIGIGVLVLAGVGYFGGHGSAAPPAPRSAAGAYSVAIEIHSSLSGIDSIVAPALVFPVHSVVTFRLVNFDLTAVGAPTAASGVQGTFDGPVMLERGPSGSQQMAGLSPPSISHTFTVSSPSLSMNVPLPSALAVSTPSVVTFTVYLNATGTYAWYCAAYCNDGGLGDAGDMGGALTVTSG